jgi:ribosomal protein S27AE
MVPPTWLDEQGRPRPKRPCPRCGREIAVLSIPADHMKFWAGGRSRSGARLSGAVSRSRAFPCRTLTAARG